MTKLITIAGLDPSLSNFGMVKGSLNMTTGAFIPSQRLLVETTSDKKNNKSVRKNSDDLNRCKLIHTQMTTFLEGVALACVEIPVGSQSARAMASYGACVGLIASITIPLIQVTPNEVKIAAVSSKTATKIEMIEWATSLYPQIDWFKRTVKGVTSFTNKNEHIADAVASIHAGVNTDEFMRLKAVISL